MEKHFAVIGDPVDHSLSPLMHSAAFRAAGINAEYLRFRVAPEDLAKAVNGLCALCFAGFNVTIPHKEKIIPFLDELTPEALRAGAVNAVKIQDGRKIGHNVDGLGFIRSLQEKDNKFNDLRGTKAVIIGAGGAAKGIAVSLAASGAQICIMNRTHEKALLLAEHVRLTGGVADVYAFKPGDWLKDADLIIQATSAGLFGEDFPFSLRGIDPNILVADVIFNPKETAFLRQARELGCRTMNGSGMLIHQGACAWKFWMDIEAPVKAMEEALQDYLF